MPNLEVLRARANKERQNQKKEEDSLTTAEVPATQERPEEKVQEQSPKGGSEHRIDKVSELEADQSALPASNLTASEATATKPDETSESNTEVPEVALAPKEKAAPQIAERRAKQSGLMAALKRFTGRTNETQAETEKVQVKNADENQPPTTTEPLDNIHAIARRKSGKTAPAKKAVEKRKRNETPRSISEVESHNARRVELHDFLASVSSEGHHSKDANLIELASIIRTILGSDDAEAIDALYYQLKTAL